MVNGEAAERIVFEFLSKQPIVESVTDTRNVKSWQDVEIDCIVKFKDGHTMWAEIKSDKHLGKSGNILFEVLRINHTADLKHAATLGWSARSRATHFLYYAPSVDKIYCITVTDLRNAMQAYTRNERARTNLNFVPTDDIKSTVNILIPEKYFKNLRIYKIKRS